jgi:hypothetical protein
LDNWILQGQDGNPAQPVRLNCWEQFRTSAGRPEGRSTRMYEVIPLGRHIHKIARLERAFIGYCVCQDRMRTRRSRFEKFVRNKFERPNDCMEAGGRAPKVGAFRRSRSNCRGRPTGRSAGCPE